jgi:dihydroorotase-like cyclic amidohydrolase
MAELLSWQPAKLAGLSHRKGKIEVGYDADLTVSSAVASDTTSTSSDL